MSDLLLLEEDPAVRQDARHVPADPLHIARACEAPNVTSEDLTQFICDPFGYAARSGAARPEAFVHAYLQGLERRLGTSVGAPKAAPQRLATLSADDLSPFVPGAPGSEAPAAVGDRVDDAHLAPRMGPVLVACAVVTAATAVVQAATAISLALAKHAAQ